MTTFGARSRWRDALLDAMIPAPGGGLPAMAAIDRSAFWPAFERSAPLLLRLGFFVATVGLAGLAPLLLGRWRGFLALDAAGRDEVLRRAETLPGAFQLVQVVKVVACFAYFADARVQAAVRGTQAA